jgi:hypothetical protein
MILLRTQSVLHSQRRQPAATVALVVAIALVSSPRAFALITGGEGNKPINDPGWPKGAAAIFNHPARVAWWEGPPFGGGQWHAECRGGAKTLNAILIGFSKLEVGNRRVYVHDGEGQSFWLNLNREPEKREAAKIDWMFMVWQPANWQRLSKLPASLNPTSPGDAESGPPTELHVYTGGQVRWSEVTLPTGIEVVDQRLEAHGFKAADGTVFEGRMIDLATGKPLPGRMRLQRVEPQAKGGYQYPVIADAAADSHGRWELKHVPAGWVRFVIEADGFVPRVAGYAQIDDQPHWSSYEVGLATPAAVSGCVTDESSQPLADVNVRFSDVAVGKGERYESSQEYQCKTGSDGRFHIDRLPRGTATIWLSKFGYCRPGLGQPINTPEENVALVMTRSARLRVKVDFGASKRPEGYLVQIEPECGSVVGSWGGSGNIDAHDEVSFSDIPPGRYKLSGQPNPSRADQQTTPITVDLKGGRLTEVTIEAKP